MKKAIIFDMDGTLWDSVDNIVISWNEACRRLNLDITITREDLMGLMGNTMDVFAKVLLKDVPLEQALQTLHVCELDENEYLRKHGAVLLGDVKTVFEKIREQGYGIYIVSNCQSGYIEAFTEYYQLTDLVDDFECYGNTMQGKAANLKALIQRNHLENYRYVGDTRGDYNACQEANVPFIWAAYGFGQIEEEVSKIMKLEDVLGFL
jgi:phosphoglycolate phosphatase